MICCALVLRQTLSFYLRNAVFKIPGSKLQPLGLKRPVLFCLIRIPHHREIACFVMESIYLQDLHLICYWRLLFYQFVTMYMFFLHLDEEDQDPVADDPPSAPPADPPAPLAVSPRSPHIPSVLPLIASEMPPVVSERRFPAPADVAPAFSERRFPPMYASEEPAPQPAVISISEPRTSTSSDPGHLSFRGLLMSSQHEDAEAQSAATARVCILVWFCYLQGFFQGGGWGVQVLFRWNHDPKRVLFGFQRNERDGSKIRPIPELCRE